MEFQFEVSAHIIPQDRCRACNSQLRVSVLPLMWVLAGMSRYTDLATQVRQGGWYG